MIAQGSCTSLYILSSLGE